jgi:hypothetical protein
VVADPTTYTPEGATITDTPTMSMIYCLNLPQEIVSTSTGQNTLEAFGTLRAKRTLEEFSNQKSGVDDWSDVGLPIGTNSLKDDDLNVLLQLPVNKRNYLSERSAALKLLHLPTVLFQSPRLARVLTSGDTRVTTYTGDFDFLNDQATFDKTFPSRQIVSFNAETQEANMNKFIYLCMLEVIFQMLLIVYVGDLSPSLTSSTIGLTTALRNLKMRALGDTTSSSPSNPDDLFQAFADIATQLSDTTLSWGLTLAHQFHAALRIEYRDDIEANDTNHYKLPDPASPVTDRWLLTQRSALILCSSSSPRLCLYTPKARARRLLDS